LAGAPLCSSITGLLFNDRVEWITLLVMLLVLLAVVPLVNMSDRGRRAAELRARRIERKLDLVMEHLGIHVQEPDAPPGVMDELAVGRKIEAIKLYRQATGAGLKEAKDAVEALAKRHLQA
jgi:ribosomal protein L7/L12